jgi:hypothetical protein
VILIFLAQEINFSLFMRTICSFPRQYNGYLNVFCMNENFIYQWIKMASTFSVPCHVSEFRRNGSCWMCWKYIPPHQSFVGFCEHILHNRSRWQSYDFAWLVETDWTSWMLPGFISIAQPTSNTRPELPH